MNKTSCEFTILLFILNAGLLFAEDPVDGDTIYQFPQKWAVSLSSKYNMGIFQQQPASYRTDKPWDIGIGLRYKNLAAQGFIPLSLKGGSFDIAVNFYLKKMYFETLIKRYQNFYINGDDNTVGNEDIGLDVMSSGILAGWVHNHTNHSLRSVYTLSEKQTASSGSFLYGFGVFYSSLYSQGGIIPRYNERQHIVYFGPAAGYSYTWIFKHDLFLNMAFTVGTDLGININDTKLLFIPQINPKIVFGHHNNSWSINTVMGNNTSFFLWSSRNFEILIPVTISVTFSKRF
jgi:hypothetical protein